MSEITPDIRATEEDEGYRDLENQIGRYIASHKGPLFRTNAVSVFEAYVHNLPKNNQHYNCRCCKRFIEEVGTLVRLTQEGHMECAALPPDVPAFFQKSFTIMRKLVLGSKVTGVYVNKELTLGIPLSPKGWTHLHAANPDPYASLLLEAPQREAELLENFGLVHRTIQEYALTEIQVAVRILEAEKFVGYEKGLGIAKWFLELHSRIKNSRLANNIIWHAVALAPPGFAHLKNGMVGTLLDDIKAGKSYSECERAWRQKMNPSRYQRPTAAPTVGQVLAAEKTVAKLGVEKALERRFANMEDMKHVFWRHSERTVNPTGLGLFGHLLTAPAKPTMELPETNVTWNKFQRDVLPGVRQIELWCPSYAPYMQMVTATDPTAPPIIQWDLPDARNPVSYYVYKQPRPPARWNIAVGWNKVDALSFAPFHGIPTKDRDFVFFIISGCRDLDGGSIALFPEILKSEFHGIRSVIEAYSKDARLTGSGPGNVAGLAFAEGGATLKIRVNGDTLYNLDRWE